MSEMIKGTAEGVIEWAKILGDPWMDKEFPVIGGQWSVDLIVSNKERKRLETIGLKGSEKEPNRFKFKRNGISKRTGKHLKPPVVVDSDKTPWDTTELIGNGSEGKVKFFAYEHKFTKQYGLGKGIEVVQVTNHVPYDSEASVVATTAEEDDDF